MEPPYLARSCPAAEPRDRLLAGPSSARGQSCLRQARVQRCGVSGMPDPAAFRQRVRLAYGDAWQALGHQFEGRGGGTAEVAGMRLMASGLPPAQWNGADVTDSCADLAAARIFFASRHVAWGVRVPAELDWQDGQRLLTLQLMGLPAARFSRVSPPQGVTLRLATIADLQTVLDLDEAAFGLGPPAGREWIAALLTAPDEIVAVVCAEWKDTAVGTGYCVCTDGWGGPSVHLAGIAVRPEVRRHGLGGAISSWLIDRGLSRGAQLGHLHADDERAERVYARLGFVKAGRMNVFVNL